LLAAGSINDLLLLSKPSHSNLILKSKLNSFLTLLPLGIFSHDIFKAIPIKKFIKPRFYLWDFVATIEPGYIGDTILADKGKDSEI
jgi:hypothetical protein